jgi:hypothetical protein
MVYISLRSTAISVMQQPVPTDISFIFVLVDALITDAVSEPKLVTYTLSLQLTTLWGKHLHQSENSFPIQKFALPLHITSYYAKTDQLSVQMRCLIII